METPGGVYWKALGNLRSAWGSVRKEELHLATMESQEEEKKSCS